LAEPSGGASPDFLAALAACNPTRRVVMNKQEIPKEKQRKAKLQS
jgi:hypothetical protein